MFLSAILINNIVLSKFLGMCPFMGVSTRLENAIGMGVAVIFVIFGASILSWCLYYFLLVPLHLEYMELICFILLIAAFVQFVEMFVKKNSPTLYKQLGIYLPLITTNCAVLGVTTLNINNGYNFAESIINAIGSGVGYMVAMILFAGVRGRLETASIPKCLQGLPITLIAASIVACSFLGFGGMVDGIFGL
jgi:electron transport complex protein RnfA